MAPMVYLGGSSIGNAALAAGWIFAALALLTLVLVLLSGRMSYDVLLLILAALVATVLAIQSTWAVVDEGQGSNIQDETPSQISLVVKVLFFWHDKSRRVSWLMQAVPLVKRSALGGRQYYLESCYPSVNRENFLSQWRRWKGCLSGAHDTFQP